MDDATVRSATSRTLDLPLHPSSAGAARRFVAAHLEEAGLADVSEVAELLMSELVTNSLLHARTAMRIEVTHGDGRVRIAVHDGCRVLGSPRPVPREVDDRGFMLVESLADDWGSQQTDWGKVTWCTLSSVA